MSTKIIKPYNKHDNRFQYLRKDIPVNKVVVLYKPNVQLNCQTEENAVKVQWLYHDNEGSLMIRTISDNEEVRNPQVYALNLTKKGQNTLVIRNATMKIAGTYNCLVSYSTSDVKSYSAELNVVTVGRLMGWVVAPLMHFNWKLIYNGRMKPIIKCSNGRTLFGIKRPSKFNYVDFDSCFLPENLPNYCDIFFKDRLRKWTRFKRYKIKLIKNENPTRILTEISIEDITVVKKPRDFILNVNYTMNAELLCEVLPPPHSILWTFVDFESKCYRFGNLSAAVSQSKEAPGVYRTYNKNQYSSKLNLIELGYPSAGQYRCIVIYYYKNIVQKTLSAEVVIVSKMSEFIEMKILKDFNDGKEVLIKFEIYYTGNLRPILQCVNKIFEPIKIRREELYFKAKFSSTQIIPMIPHECDVKFVNQLSQEHTLFQNVYIKLIGNLFRDLVVDSENNTNRKIFQNPKPSWDTVKGNRFQNKLAESETHLFPKHVIARKHLKQTIFDCVIKVQFITLTWTLDGVSKRQSGIIYQKDSGISLNFIEFFAINTTKSGQHSLIVLQVRPITAGTYTCVVTYQNQTTLSYSAELVLANMQNPMSLKYTDNKLECFFHCSLRYCGKMKPFLRCENELDQYGVVIQMNIQNLVVFEKLMNFTEMPIVCSLWFKHSKGDEIFFKSPTQFSSNSNGMGGQISVENSLKISKFNVSCIFLLTIIEIVLF